MPQGLLDLTGKQLEVMTEVAFERVAVDDDPILVAFGSDSVAKILAVGMAFGSEIGDNHCYPLENALKFLRKRVNRVGHEGFEAVRLGLIHCRTTLTSNPIWSHLK